jgi:hypothetical protein
VSTGRFNLGYEVDQRSADRQGLWAALRDRAEEVVEREPSKRIIHPYVAMSRQAGAGGEEIAQRLSKRLGWRVLGRQVLDAIASEYKVDAKMLALLDETSLSWFGDSILSLMNPRLIGQDAYAARMAKVVLVTASHESTVVVGRGAYAFLPHERGVAVRLVATEADRVARIQRQQGLDESAARHWMHETDHQRDSFVKHEFGCDPSDPLAFDLVVNTSRSGVDGAADLVIAELRSRGLLSRAGSPTGA